MIRRVTRFALLTLLGVGYLLAEAWLFKSGFSFSDIALFDFPLTLMAVALYAAICAVTGGLE
jgi:hypothetical protein